MKIPLTLELTLEFIIYLVVSNMFEYEINENRNDHLNGNKDRSLFSLIVKIELLIPKIRGGNFSTRKGINGRSN